MSLAECSNTLYLILTTICCKKVRHFSEILLSRSQRNQNRLPKTFSYFLSKCETLPNKFVLFSTLLCLIVGREGVNKMHQGGGGRGIITIS